MTATSPDLRPGFSLIELMVALAIFGILLMLAGPQLGTFLSSSQVRNAAEATLNGVQRTQATAIAGNTSARLVLDPTTGSGGWQVLETIDGAEPAPPNPIQVYLLADGAPSATLAPKPNGATQITFDGFGRIVANADATATLRCIDVGHARDPSARPLRIVISNTAMSMATKLCYPDTGDPSKDVPAKDPKACPAGACG